MAKFKNRILTRLEVDINEGMVVGVAVLFGVSLLCVGAHFCYTSRDTNQIVFISATVFVTVIGSVVAAAIFVLLAYLFRNLQNYGKKKALKELLCIDGDLKHALKNKKVSIVIPRFKNFDMCEACSNEDDPVNSAIKDRRMTNKYSLAWDDVVAVRHITQIFTDLKLRAPYIYFDDDIYKRVYKDKIYSRRTFIVIGLYSNCVTMEAANGDPKNDERCFFISDVKRFYEGKRCITICDSDAFNDSWDYCIEVDVKGKPKKYGELKKGVKSDGAGEKNEPKIEKVDKPIDHDKKDDYGLIAKCKAPNENTLLILAGAKARGTRKISSYFRQHYSDIVEFKDDEKKVRVGSRSFAKYYKIKGKTDKKQKIVPEGRHLTVFKTDTL